MLPVSLLFFTLSQGFIDTSSTGTSVSSADKPALPDGWNTADVYTLQYRHTASGHKVLVKGIKMEGDILILNMAVSLAVQLLVEGVICLSCDSHVMVM